MQPSYVHGHSGLLLASSRHSGAVRGGYGKATLSTDTVLSVYSCDRAVLFSRRLTARRARSRWSERCRLSLVVRPRRLSGTSGRPLIDWPPRGPGVRRLRVTSGLLTPRPRCRRASRQRLSAKPGMWRRAVVFVN
jgi:hypothetical protein